MELTYGRSLAAGSPLLPFFGDFFPVSKWTVKIDVTACKRSSGPWSQKSSEVTKLAGELIAEQHFIRYNALS